MAILRFIWSLVLGAGIIVGLLTGTTALLDYLGITEGGLQAVVELPQSMVEALDVLAQAARKYLEEPP